MTNDGYTDPQDPTQLYVDASVCPVCGAIVHDRQVHADWHAQPNNTRRNVTMTSVFKSDEDRQDCIEWVMECYRDAESLVYQYPIGQLIDHAERLPEGTPPIRELIFSAPKEYLDTLPEKVVDGLKFLGTAAGRIVYDTPEILWAFAKAVGIDGEVGERLDEQYARERAAEADPDSPINRMRRRYQEMKQQS